MVSSLLNILCLLLLAVAGQRHRTQLGHRSGVFLLFTFGIYRIDSCLKMPFGKLSSFFDDAFPNAIYGLAQFS